MFLSPTMYIHSTEWDHALTLAQQQQPALHNRHCITFISIKQSIFRPHHSNLIEQGLTTHQTHYRSYRGRLLRSYDQTNTVKALKEPVGLADKAWIPKAPLHHVTIIQLSPEVLFQDLRHDEIRGWWWWWWTLGNHLYARCKAPNMTNPICWTCKNCSHECAADCEHCVTQPSTEQFW